MTSLIEKSKPSDLGLDFSHGSDISKIYDSCPTQLLLLVNERHKSFENPKSLRLWTVYLDISKVLD